jgi:hypothetical protein
VNGQSERPPAQGLRQNAAIAVVGAVKIGVRCLRVKTNLLKQFNLILSVQSHSKKFSTLPVGQIISTSPPCPASKEGRFAIVTNVECGMQWTRRHGDERLPFADGEVVWS